MGGGQSQESSTATATRNSVDQRISGRDVSSRKSAGVPPSSSSQIDSSRRRYLVVDDGLRGDRGGRGGGESDDSPSARHHSLSQPSPHHPPHSHLHVHSHHGNSSHNQRPHPHRQQHRHHNHRPPPPPLPDSFPPVNMELSVPILTSSRTQPMANEPTTESLHPELGLVLPSRHRRYYEARNPEDMELDLSMASLSRRLRAVGLIAEDSGNGGSANGGSGSSSSSRRHHRPRRHHSHNSHSGRSRHHLSTPSSVVLVRGLSARMTCPLCSKEFSSADLEEHLLTCMTKPRVRYNVDTLQQDSGECSICLEDMLSGEQIARLPCLCIYHIQCIKQWYKVNPTCPEHPDFTA